MVQTPLECSTGNKRAKCGMGARSAIHKSFLLEAGLAVRAYADRSLGEGRQESSGRGAGTHSRLKARSGRGAVSMLRRQTAGRVAGDVMIRGRPRSHQKVSKDKLWLVSIQGQTRNQ